MSDHPTDDSPSNDGVEMIRSEERLRVRMQQVPARIARLEKYVVTEQRTITVDVRREAVRLVYTDAPTGAAALGDAASSAAQRILPELVLSEEQVEVRTTVVPVERVRLVVDTVTEQQQLTGTVRREAIVAEQKQAATAPSPITPPA